MHATLVERHPDSAIIRLPMVGTKTIDYGIDEWRCTWAAADKASLVANANNHRVWLNLPMTFLSLYRS